MPCDNSISGRSGLYVRYHVQVFTCSGTLEIWKTEICGAGIEPAGYTYQSPEVLSNSKFSYVKHFALQYFLYVLRLHEQLR